MDQELTSMRMSKKDMPKASEVSDSPSGPQYPWGLGVTLEREALAKMGIKLSDYAVGDTVELYAKCKVTRLSQSESEGNNNPNRTMELQITDMCLEECEPGEKKDEDELSWDDDSRSEKATKKLKEKY